MPKIADIDLRTLQEQLGVTLRDSKLLEQALTHRSYLNEAGYPPGLAHNERLEFLGDAVLEFVVTEYLFERFRDKSEGVLTVLRAALVKSEMLADIAEEFGFAELIRMSRSERKSVDGYERSRKFILANAFEAVIGAIYLDRGIGAVEVFLEKCLLSKIKTIIAEGRYLDPKGYFQELSQEHLRITPHYEVLNESGPDHDRRFVIGAYLNLELAGKGTASSKQEAEQEAARDALQKKFQVELPR